MALGGRCHELLIVTCWLFKRRMYLWTCTLMWCGNCGNFVFVVHIISAILFSQERVM